MQATTVEFDNSNFNDLKDQIINKSEVRANSETVPQQKGTEQTKNLPNTKKFTFVKGEESYEVDDDAVIEFVADKKPVKLTLRELKDRAAGDIAVKNRMHALAEEKKKVQATMKQFASLAKDDPLGALEYIAERAKEADNEFEYNKYLEKLAEQAEKLGGMDEKERKALELEKKLSKAEKNLSLKERENLAIQRKQEILSNYPEIGDSQFADMVEAVLSSEVLLDGVEDEKGVLDKVEELIEETLIQRDIRTVVSEINPRFEITDDFVFTLSDQIRQNPDLDEEDIKEIIADIVKPSVSDSKKDFAVRTLSQKQRQRAPMDHLKAQGSTDLEILKSKLLEQKEKIHRTPVYMR